jgi:hypothetical protein
MQIMNMNMHLQEKKYAVDLTVIVHINTKLFNNVTSTLSIRPTAQQINVELHAIFNTA